MKIIFLAFVISIFFAETTLSQSHPYGQEFQASTYAQSIKEHPAAAALSNGGFVVCWQSTDQDGSDWGIFAQRFDAFGAKLGGEFQINTYAQGLQWTPVVVGLKNGGFVVCWEGALQNRYGSTILGQLFDASGVKHGNEFEVSANPYAPGNPAIVCLTDGAFVVSWQEGLYGGIRGQIFESSGAKRGREFQVNPPPPPYIDRGDTQVAALQNGGFVVCWVSWSDNWDVFGQIYDALGRKIGAEFQANSYTQDAQLAPAVTGLSDGTFVTCWSSNIVTPPFRQIFFQRFNALGTKIGREFRASDSSGFADNFPAIASFPNNDFVICWQKVNEQTASIWGQQFQVSGEKKEYVFKVNTASQAYSNIPTTSVLTNGSFVVAWQDSKPLTLPNQIFGRLLPERPLVHELRDFLLIAPLHDASLNTTLPTFLWQQPGNLLEAYPWEITFDLYLDTSSAFSSARIIHNIQDTTYISDHLEAGRTYFWQVIAKNVAGDSILSTQQNWGFAISPTATAVEAREGSLPTGFVLHQNHPNPFNAGTEIRYELPPGKSAYQVSLRIYDLHGRLVKELANASQTPGAYSVAWDGTNFESAQAASNVYIYTLHAGDFKETKKLLLLK